MMGSLGHSKAFGQLLKVRVRGVLAWFVRRTYYLLQMPGWSRRLRIMIDWTFALLFRPDIVKLSLESEAALILREAEADGVIAGAPQASFSGIQLDNGHRAGSQQVDGAHQATGRSV
jgi:NADH:ubiquinone reductase (H+-translocating)